jgi:hypothetical protein
MRCFIGAARRVGRHDCNFGELGRQLRRRRDFEVRITDCHHGPTLALERRAEASRERAKSNVEITKDIRKRFLEKIK